MKSTQLSALLLAGIVVCSTPFLDSCSSTQPVSEQMSDSSITTRVKAKFIGDNDVNSRDISVETSEGVVYLTGRVQSREARDEAERIARNTEGVKKVVNNIKVGDKT